MTVYDRLKYMFHIFFHIFPDFEISKTYPIVLTEIYCFSIISDYANKVRTYASSTKTIWFLAQERLHKSSIVAIFAAIPEG
jgi:hypothetical protein